MMTIQSLSTQIPGSSLTQSEIARLVAPVCASDTRQSDLIESLFRRAGIKRRSGVVFDSATFNAFYPVDRNPTTGDRMNRYERDAIPLATHTASIALREFGAKAIDHLVTASCTGFSAPGVDIALIDSLGLDRNVSRTNVGFMGCHGAFNALRVAGALVMQNPASRILVVATELCGLHLQYGWDAQQLVTGALFADGCAAAVCGASEQRGQWKVLANGSYVVPNSKDAMTWKIGDHGFVMTLSPQVPELIKANLRQWVMEWLKKCGTAITQVQNWAVHPGGMRILSAAGEALGLSDEQLKVSRNVLAGKGNMSSPTILFILDEMAREGATGQTVALGFGPGLTIEAMLLQRD